MKTVDVTNKTVNTYTVGRTSAVQTRQLVQDRCQQLERQYVDQVEKLKLKHADTINQLYKQHIVPLKTQVNMITFF